MALRPEDEWERVILDELEQRTNVPPEQVVDDGTRRYPVHSADTDVDAFDPILDSIDPAWRDHITNWRD